MSRSKCFSVTLAIHLLACALAPPSYCVPASAHPFATESMNLGFENAERVLPTGWSAGPLGGYEVAPDTAVVRTGGRSMRITSTPDGHYGSLWRRIAAAPLVGKHVRLRGWVRTKAVTGWAVLFLRVDGGQSTYVMSDGPIGTSSGWSEIVADANIAPGQDLTLGIAVGGEGTAWFDDLSLEVVELAPEVPIQLAGRVVDPSGVPVSGADVALIAPNGAVAQHVRTLADGGFNLQTTSGRWALSASAPDRPELVGMFLEPRDFPTSAEQVLTLGADAGVRVQGQVAGAAPAGVYLRVAAYSNFSGDVWAVPLSPAGKFATTLPRADRFKISVLSGGFGGGEARSEGDVAIAALDVVLEQPTPAPASVLDWISRNAIPLVTVDPEVPVKNPAALRKLVGAARVVALGEATHGTREFFQLKHRVFRALIDEGFTVFALEIGQADARAINAYVLNGTGNAREALGGAGMWMWETEEILELVEWMRTWNADPRHNSKLQFVGFDMQSPISSFKAVRAFLEQVAPGDAAAWLAPIDVLQHEAKLAGFVALSKERRAEVVAAVASLNERFSSSQGAWAAATSPAAFVIARQDARTLQQATAYLAALAQSQDASAMRDEAMAENIKWLHDNLPPGARMVVSAHNLHIADVKDRMGKTLRATLGPAWLSIGLELGDGSYQALRMRTDGARANIEAIRFPPPPPGQANAALLHGGPVYALDLRTLPAAGEVATWFRSPQIVRAAGYGVSSDAAMTGPQVLAERYDALLFVAHTTRARPLPVDFTRLP